MPRSVSNQRSARWLRAAVTGVGLATVVLAAGIAAGAGVALAQGHAPLPGRGWTKQPTITISTRAGDSRIGLVVDAIDFWNRQLAAIGTSFRLGQAALTAEVVPADYLARLSEAVVERSRPRPEVPDVVRGMGADMVITLSDGNFVSFAAWGGSTEPTVVGIKSEALYPLTLPNVARNLIAHELGHAIGLGHNADAATLMCGRPALCRPDAFQSGTERYFPLTDGERRFLRALYPPDWKPTR